MDVRTSVPRFVSVLSQWRGRAGLAPASVTAHPHVPPGIAASSLPDKPTPRNRPRLRRVIDLAGADDMLRAPHTAAGRTLFHGL